jgi:hypothetical protein
MSSTEKPAAGGAPLRDIPIDWEALEDAFENNAPEVHSYLHLVTGDVLRVVDGVADPQMHARIAVGRQLPAHRSGELSRAIPLDGALHPDGGGRRISQAKLSQAIDGKGAFRRFKDVLMSFAPERERWFAFRSERLRIFMEAWLSAHALAPVERPVWVAEPALDDAEPPPRRPRSAKSHASLVTRASRAEVRAPSLCAAPCAKQPKASARASWRPCLRLQSSCALARRRGRSSASKPTPRRAPRKSLRRPRRSWARRTRPEGFAESFELKRPATAARGASRTRGRHPSAGSSRSGRRLGRSRRPEARR